MEKKRYILFYCSEYYPSGGIRDAELTFNSIDEVEPDEFYNGDYHVFDVETFNVGYGDTPFEAFEKLQKVNKEKLVKEAFDKAVEQFGGMLEDMGRN